MRLTRIRSLVIAFGIVLSSGPAFAQQPAAEAMQAEIVQLRQVVDELEKRLATLEGT